MMVSIDATSFSQPRVVLHHTEVVVTGLGIVSPIGIGREAFWNSLCRGRSGVGTIERFDPTGLPIRLAAEVRDFDPRQQVAQRKQLKVMCRDAQFGVAAARLACRDAGLGPGRIDPERLKAHAKQVRSGLPGLAYVKIDPDTPWPATLLVRPAE